jgi:hypothetical protein
MDIESARAEELEPGDVVSIMGEPRRIAEASRHEADGHIVLRFVDQCAAFTVPPQKAYHRFARPRIRADEVQAGDIVYFDTTGGKVVEIHGTDTQGRIVFRFSRPVSMDPRYPERAAFPPDHRFYRKAQ